ncbi:MAG: aspartate aminotransferase family protein [Promethearchaeota archaeon]
MVQPLKLEKSDKLYNEALELIPGAILGIRRPYNFVVGEYPIFFDNAKGGKVYDVDGNEYLDYLCAYGPIIIGHREESIDNAVIEQIQDKGFCFSLTQPIQNQLAKKLKSLIPSCEKCVFVKTGSDATTTAVRIARGYTNRTKILRCGYHGWHDWCVEVKGGIPNKLYEDVFEFEYNNLADLEALMAVHGNEVAGIIITPVGHPLAHEVQMPKTGYLQAVKDLAHKYGAVLIFDEIRTGFRVTLGGAQQEFGVTPDLSVFGKAIANGYPVSAVVGKKEIMDVLKHDVFLSSTFFSNSLAQVAAMATIEMMERENVLGVIRKKGNEFGKAVEDLIVDTGVPCTFSGGPWMPFITFNHDPEKKYKTLRNTFYTSLIRQKVFLQPYHHGYIAYRHTEEDLAYTLDVIRKSFLEIKQL